MTQISNIINKLQDSNFQTIDLKERRPFFRMDWESFVERLTINANAILKTRGAKLNFQLYNEDLSIITQLYYYAIGHEQCEYDLNKGIAILGSIGRGKTLLMQAYLQLFNQDPLSKNVTFIDSLDYANRLSDFPELYTNNFKRPLYLDDMGKEPAEINIYGTKRHPIGELICARYNYGAITFFTSNYNLDTLTNHYGKHVVDRLVEQCTFVYLTGKSRRQ
jgi:DNA replication protein DnaC